VLKIGGEVKTLEGGAKSALQELFTRVHAIKLRSIEALSAGGGIEFVARFELGGRPHELLCEVKASGQPRQTRAALLRLRGLVHQSPTVRIPFFIAPYIPPAARALCQEHDVGFLDLEGNCRLVFDGVYIERTVATKPPAERRELRSLFTPKAAQILRVMLREPRRSWRVTALAEAADVSLGQVSNVRAALLDKEWAEVGAEGFSIAEPDALLDAWRDTYQGPAGQRLGFYTTLHGSAFEEAARRSLRAANERGAAMLASFSAAQWLAPYARVSTHYFYADETGVTVLQDALKLSSTAKGENVIITCPRDSGLFRDGVERAPGVLCTSPVQTFLDLSASGERGREAADHLRREMLTWSR
jgi:hypothetical protein